MTRERASLARTWLRLEADLAREGLDPFHVGLTPGQRVAYTVFVLAIALAMLVWLDPWGALVVLAVGLWAVWNRGNQVTRRERQLWLTALATSLFLGLIEKAALLGAALVLVLAYAAILGLVWRRRR